MFNWQLSYQEIRWPVSRDRIEGSDFELIKVTCFWSWPLTKYWISFGSRAHVRLSCGKQGRIVRKPVSTNPGFKVNQNITFSPMQRLFLLCFVYMVIIKTQNRRPNNIQKTSPQSYKTQIKILPFPGLAYRALINLAQKLRFQAGLNRYIKSSFGMYLLGCSALA